MKRLSILITCCVFLITSYGQVPIDLTFTAIDGADYVQPDSIKVMNRTQGSDTVLHYPDTVLSFIVTGTDEFIPKESRFQLFQNYPNPVKNKSTVSIQIPSDGKVNILVSDILGRSLAKTHLTLRKGIHSFNFTPGNGELYFFTARYKNESQTIKMMCAPYGSDNKVSLQYVGISEAVSGLKASKQAQGFSFNYGDELLYIGYYDTLQSGILDSPEVSDTYIFQFAYDIPCLGTPTVEYEGQTYNTVQIMSQCWLKENLNVGTMISGEVEMSDNDTIEKYCYNNEPDSCVKYGGLYQWDEMMHYETHQGVQGICPPGWHLPSDEEWKVLEGSVDSQHGIGNSIWDEDLERGYDAGINLKTLSGWYENGTDSFGFSGLPGGIRNASGGFLGNGGKGRWWTSAENDDGFPWGRGIGYDYHGVNRIIYGYRSLGISVRCLRDEFPSSENITKLSFTGIDNADYVQLDSIKVMNRTHEGEKVMVYPDTTLNLEFELPNYHTEDQLLLVGYYDTLQSGILDIPEEDKTYTFQFAYDIPCPGTPTVEYEGQTYNTVQIMSQCWLKENLNVGTMIPGEVEMSDNDTIEKYCYNNETDSCNKYGGLYQWDEMMQYSIEQGAQGICPPGWHLPTDEDWKILEGTVDSQYGIGDPEWEGEVPRGFDAGTNLKTIIGWDDDGNGSDLYDFSGLPGGIRWHDGTFRNIRGAGEWWTSSQHLTSMFSWWRSINQYQPTITRSAPGVNMGYSVRCIND